MAEDHLIGWATLAKGRHTLTFVCVGRTVPDRLQSRDRHVRARDPDTAGDAADAIGERAEAIRAIADHSTRRADGRARADAALRDPDAEVRAAAAWTLGQLKGSPRSIQALTALSAIPIRSCAGWRRSRCATLVLPPRPRWSLVRSLATRRSA